MAEANRRATSREVADAAGVSQATVSNVLNRPDVVAPETRERVTRAMESLNFVVNRSARELRMGSSEACGVIVLDIANPFWAQVTSGIESVTGPLERAVLLASSGESTVKERQLLHQLEAAGLLGLLVAPTGEHLDELWRIQARGTGVVLIDHDDATGRLPAVALDHVAGARLATNHLIAQGHRRIAMVNGSIQNHWCRDRRAGYEQVCRSAGITPLEVAVDGMTVASGFDCVSHLLAIDGLTAVFCVNDMVALGVLKGLSERGVGVPEEISVIGYDDSEFSAMLSPALTTVRQSAFAIGAAAARVLFNIESVESANRSLEAPVLVDRQSVVPAR